MPRGPVVFTLPPGSTPQSPGDVIQSAVWNAAMDDVAQTFNTIQPEAYGGTGAATFQGALDNLFDGTNTVDGIRFPATQVPSSNANTLDDYEEGTWNPTRSGFTETGGGTVTLDGRYTKIGRFVKVTARLTPSGGAQVAAVAGTSLISNLPFTPTFPECGTFVDATTENVAGLTSLRTTGSMILVTSFTARSSTIIFTATYEA